MFALAQVFDDFLQILSVPFGLHFLGIHFGIYFLLAVPEFLFV